MSYQPFYPSQQYFADIDGQNLRFDECSAVLSYMMPDTTPGGSPFSISPSSSNTTVDSPSSPTESCDTSTTSHSQRNTRQIKAKDQRRKEQNRVAQRAYRARKERSVELANAMIADLQAEVARLSASERRQKVMTDTMLPQPQAEIVVLQAANATLLAGLQSVTCQLLNLCDDFQRKTGTILSVKTET